MYVFMKKNYFFLHLLFWMCASLFAQNKTINQLGEVVVSDAKLQKFSGSQTILTLNDSVIAHNQSLLTDLLQNNSVIYFKQYGRGMLSTVSFRGTTASQTAVLWNGININSQMNGQTDFNTLSTQGYNSIAVKGGGGSILYGSGAIGGTVHLNDHLVFDSKWTHTLQYNYGIFNTQDVRFGIKGIRFNTQDLRFGTHYATKKLSVQVGFTQNYSDNNYKYAGVFDWKGNQRYNLNGEYSLNTFNASLGYKFNTASILKFYSQYSITDRNLVVQSESESKAKYINAFSRNLIDFSTTFKRWNLDFKTAFLTEEYRYFADKENDGYTFGKTQSVLGKADISYQLGSGLVAHSLFD
ncbi:MAG: Vitamin transporter BtuB, partial [Bacteroidota bacterium]|nr:Vitamin transporter BtuB [Bacteroidota bacterium]